MQKGGTVQYFWRTPTGKEIGCTPLESQCGTYPRLLLGDQRIGRTACHFARLFRRARQYAVDRRVRAVCHRIGDRRGVVAPRILRLCLAALPHIHRQAATDRRLYRRVSGSGRRVTADLHCGGLSDPSGILWRRSGAWHLCRHRRGGSAVVAVAGSGGYRQ